MKIQVPAGARLILEELNNNGFEGFVVGGCVRDSLMNKVPKDWDITTAAKPGDVLTVFDKAGYKTVPTGIKHGTITILVDNNPYEVTTYRIDGDYSDARRPDSVEFASSLRDDLSRRDFTMNAMAYNGKAGLLDPFGGQRSISERTVICVGDPDKRFSEDALRMLRAVRFSAQLDFEIHEGTKQAITKNRFLLEKISRERIRDEFNKILLSRPQRLLMLHETGLLKYIVPEFQACIGFSQDNPYHIYDVGEHIIKTIDNIEESLVLRLTMLLHDIVIFR